jgi:hypothetical protein
LRRRDLRKLEEALTALANVRRLELLELLKQPKGYSEIDLSPTRSDDGRPISREAVRKHVQKLVDIGVVVERTNPGDQRKQFVLDPARLFSLFERLRHLAQIQPTSRVSRETQDHDTDELDDENPHAKTDGPHLVLTRGVEEGRTFELPDPEPTGALSVGRAKANDVVLDYDAFVSSRHAEIETRQGRYFVVDLPQNKNGTFLNWERLDPGTPAPLEAGDILGVGRSRLVFRD